MKINPQRIAQTLRSKKYRVLAASLVLLLLLVVRSCTGSAGDTDSSDNLDRYYTVERGDFNVTVLARGKLDAIKNYEIKFDGKGKLGLIVEHVVKDKTEVKAGERIVSFDTLEYTEAITSLEEDIFDAKFDFDERLLYEEELLEERLRKLEESLDDSILNNSFFLEEQNLARDKEISTLTESSNAYETAQDALSKYKNLDYRSKSKAQQAAIDDKEQAYYEAVDELEKVNQLLSEARLKDDATREKAERDVTISEKKLNNAMAAWETARKADRQFRRYDHPQTLRKLIIAAEKTELDLKRNLVKAESNRIQAERRYRKLVRDKYDIEQRIIEQKTKYADETVRITEEYAVKDQRLNERLEELKDDLSKLTLRAPIDGIVSLGAIPSRGREPKEIIIGTKVSPNEVVARVPDLSQFLVRCDIPEIYRSRLKKGQVAHLKNAALPELNMQGVVQDIDTMSQPINRWDSRSPRVYETKISTNKPDARLVPGMTVEVEIQVETVKNVLFIPIEAVYNNEGKTYCRLKTGFTTEEQEIKTGRASNSYVEIVEGIEESDTVLLSPQNAATGS